MGPWPPPSLSLFPVLTQRRDTWIHVSPDAGQTHNALLVHSPQKQKPAAWP